MTDIVGDAPQIGAAAFAERDGDYLNRPHIDFADPKVAASLVVLENFMSDGAHRRRLVHFWRGEFWRWNGTHYEVLPMADLRQRLYEVGHFGTKPLRKRVVDDVIDALRAVVNLTDRLEPPCWIRDSAGKPDPLEVIPMVNGLLNVGTRELMPATPAFFTLHSLPYAFDPGAPPPARLYSFLGDVWGDDEDSKRLLQWWFGYCLLPLTHQQKILILVGIIRSGKGTIVRLLQALLGKANTAAPTLGSLAQPFGLASLIGKLLAVVSDVRLSGRVDIAAVVENLLRVSGEDAVTVQRKYLSDLTVTLPTRIMLVTNEIPWFADSSGAIASRFLVLKTTRSFFDQEDVGLTAALIEELPSIFLWALEGLERLRENGRFIQPESGFETLEQMGMLASPVKAFLDGECSLDDPMAEILVADLFDAWSAWSTRNGYKHASNAQAFGRDLRAALPSVRVVQHRVTGSPPARFYTGIALAVTR